MALKNNMAEKEINLSQTNRSLVSVIIPVYKVEPYLRQCVDSVLSQTYTDFEIILVDDGSPDGCPAICDEYAAKDSRVKVIHKENGGLSDARNAGIKVAKGEYIVFVDSDDMLVENACLGKLANEIKRTHFKLYYLNNIVSEIPTEIIYSHSKIYKRNPFMKGIIKNYFKRPCAWVWVCNREFLLENDLYFYKGILHEDEEWLPRLLLSLNESDEILVFNDYFYFYRTDRTGSITQKLGRKTIDDKLFVLNRMYKFPCVEKSFEYKFLLTRAAQILVFVLFHGNSIYSNDENLKQTISDNLFLLWRSNKIRHKILYLYTKLKGF